MGKALVALLVLGLVGGCLGVFDEAEVPSPTTGVAASTTVAEPAELPWTTVSLVPSTASTSSVAGTASAARPELGYSGVDEIDCEQAEEVADWGEYEAGDIADYCDYGPDPGELPDEFDWDE